MLHGISFFWGVFLRSVDDTFVYDWVIKRRFWGLFRREGLGFALSHLPPPRMDVSGVA